MRLALKIDVDTYRGLSEGAARLASFLSIRHIPASFFVTMGPDTSGWAILRFFKHQGFLQKMKRTHANSLYGWRTILSGTLLPARPIASSFPERLQEWQRQGFEVSPHGYDHIRWHDEAAGWDPDTAQTQVERARDVYRTIFHKDPVSFAAPGWQAGAGSWQALEGLELLYHSDTRGVSPFYPRVNGCSFKTVEIPTTLPTWDEMLAWDGITLENLADRTWTLLQPQGVNVWTIHAEVEGGVYFPQFERFIDRVISEKIEWIFLPHFARELRQQPERIPYGEIAQEELPGRAGTVTCQRILHG